MSKINEAKLHSMSVHDRHTLWINARKLDTLEARALVTLIENIGLPYSEPGGLKVKSALVQKIEEVVFSLEGKAAGLAATEQGLPALAGIDPLLSATLGADYGSHNFTTHEAGYATAQMMREQGYKNSGRKGDLPSHCVARTAEIFIPAK